MTVIEFFGMTRAGKTTHLRNLETYLDAVGKSYLVSARPNIKFEDTAGLEHFHELYLESILKAHEIYEHSNYDFLIYDRGPHDRRVLLELDYNEGNVSSQILEKLDEKLEQASKTVNKGLLFLVSPEESIRRLPKQQLEGLDNSHLNIGLPTFDAGITRMECVYKKYSELSLDNPKIQIIDGACSKEETFSKVLNALSNYSI